MRVKNLQSLRLVLMNSSSKQIKWNSIKTILISSFFLLFAFGQNFLLSLFSIFKEKLPKIFVFKLLKTKEKQNFTCEDLEENLFQGSCEWRPPSPKNFPRFYNPQYQRKKLGKIWSRKIQRNFPLLFVCL